MWTPGPHLPWSWAHWLLPHWGAQVQLRARTQPVTGLCGRAGLLHPCLFSSTGPVLITPCLCLFTLTAMAVVTAVVLLKLFKTKNAFSENYCRRRSSVSSGASAVAKSFPSEDPVLRVRAERRAVLTSRSCCWSSQLSPITSPCLFLFIVVNYGLFICTREIKPVSPEEVNPEYSLGKLMILKLKL